MGETAQDRRCFVRRKEIEASKDAADRATILEGLEQQLKQGGKTLVGISTPSPLSQNGRQESEKSFQIDPRKVADEARFGGILILRPGAKISPLQAVLRTSLH